MIKLDESEPHVRRSVLASRARSGCVGGSTALFSLDFQTGISGPRSLSLSLGEGARRRQS
jgi:hypothetical protein